MSIARFGNTAALNNVAGTGNGFLAEGVAPSTVNDAYREFQARVKLMTNELPWIEVGSLGQSANETKFAFASSTSISDSSGVDLTETYSVGRRIRCVGSVTGDIQGVITASVFSSPNNTVTISFDSGSLTNETLTVYLGPNNKNSLPAPYNRQVFSSSGTWNKPAGLKRVVVTAIGGGGPGGSCNTTGGVSNSEGSGGGGGEFVQSVIQASALGSTETVTIGAGGTGSTGTPTDATDTTFGSLVTASAGGTGNAGSATSGEATASGGIGGTGGTGDVTMDGDDGGNGRVIGGNRVLQSTGGGNALAGSTRPSIDNSAGGRAGKFPGGGGSGASNLINGSTRAGGNGAAGLIIVEEYFV